jgi:hypothetical protein
MENPAQFCVENNTSKAKPGDAGIDIFVSSA